MLENDGSVSTQIRREKLRPIILWSVTTLVCYAFSVVVDHVSDDWYFALAAGTNLANGLDLSFTPDERVNAFTSPFNTLLTSLLVGMVGPEQPTTALWLHRLLAASSLGVAVIALNSITRRYRFPGWAGAFVCFGLMADGRVLSAVTSGDSTGFTILFIALIIRVYVVPHYRPAIWLGAAGGALFLAQPIVAAYAVILNVGFLLFMPGAAMGINRTAVFRNQFRAALIAVAIAGPWLVWASFNLGSALPLVEITAATQQLVNIDPLEWARQAITFPLDCLAGGTIADFLFAPASVFATDRWPSQATVLGRIFSLHASFYWLNPYGSRFGRALSLTTCAALFVAQQAGPTIPQPLFTVVLTATWISLGALFSDSLKMAPRELDRAPAHSWRVGIQGAIVVVMLLSLGVSVLSSRGLQARQLFINQGTVNAVGHWLRDNVSSESTLLISQSGQIGYLSKLDLHDYPGLSSRKVWMHRQKLNPTIGPFGGWEELTPAQIVALGRELEPDWIVLRPSTAVRLHLHDNSFLGGYEQAAVFSRRPEIENAAWVPGRKALVQDASRIIYRRLPKETESQSSSE